MRYRYVLCHLDCKVPSTRDYETAQIALNHGKYFLAHSVALRVVVIDEQGKEILRYDKEEKK